MIYIYHVTDLPSSLNILYSKEYNTYKGIGQDNCLNCFISKSRANSSDQPLVKGVVILFKWTGHKVDVNSNMKWPYPPNTLYDNDSLWRSLIPSGSNKYLYISNIFIDKKYCEEIIKEYKIINWKKFLPLIVKKKLIRKYKLEMIKKLRESVLNNKKCIIKIN